MIVALLKLLVSILVLALPVMFAARIVGARNRNFLTAVVVVTTQFCLVFLLSRIFGNQRELILILAVLLGTLINSIFLKTTLIRGFAVGLISIIGSAVLQATLLASSYAIIASAT